MAVFQQLSKASRVVACAGLILSGCAGRQPTTLSEAANLATKPPNVIVIIADDLGYADISAYGVRRIHTPNIDRIGEEGVKFTDGYSTAPVCSPSRAALQTGRYQGRFGFEYNNGPNVRDVEQHLGLPVGESTIANALGDRGYHTGIVGKWHLGSNDEFYPMNRGYDEFVGILTGATSYINPDTPGVRTFSFGEDSPNERGDRGSYNQVFEGRDKKIVHNDNEYLTDYFGRRAAQFVTINSKSAKPYFLYLAFNAPHAPLMVTEKYYNRFPQIKAEQMRIYAGMVSALDDAVGEVLRAVDATGEGDNTLIYFVSDNGCAAYQPGVCSCEPLRGGKLTHYEGGVRVPFMMRWPGRIKAGQVYRNPVSTMDIFPTTVAAAGGQMRPDRVYDGVDLVPYVTSANAGTPHHQLMWRRRPLVSIRQGDWKLWKDLGGSYVLLFNLKDDLNESRNLAGKYPEKVRELESALDEWGKDLQDPLWPSRPAESYDVCGTPFTLPI